MPFVEIALVVSFALNAADTGPRVFLLDGQALVETRAKLQAGNDTLATALDTLRKDADASLAAGPFSVMDKPFTPPSGDKHDYMSVGPYWWPDPETKDGLPYIRKDGIVNPEREKYDNVGLGQMTHHVKTLAFAFWFTSEERYAEHAARLLRAWFLDQTTRMNPNLKFAQAIPGRVEGRGTGIIDTAGLPELLDAVGLLAASKSWSESDQAGLVQWFKDYIMWLTTHEYGIAEARADNNHGTWYDVQMVSFAFFVGGDALAKRVLSEAGERRIAVQVEPDGRQPHELARTKSYGYSVMNLCGFFELARLGEHAGIDLWRFKTQDGRNIRTALDWILAHGFGGEEWTYQNLQPISPDSILPLLWRAANVYRDGGYDEWLRKLGKGGWPQGREQLLLPRSDSPG